MYPASFDLIREFVLYKLVSTNSIMAKMGGFFNATHTKYIEYHRNPQKAHLRYQPNVPCKLQPYLRICSIGSGVYQLKTCQKWQKWEVFSIPRPPNVLDIVESPKRHI